MAPDATLPLQAITLHCMCELKDAFEAFTSPPSDLKQNLPKGFPDKWSASINLAPKIDTDFNARAGLTGTSKGPNTNTFFNTWSLGTSPGAGIDVKSNAYGGVTYYVHAHDLLTGNLDCRNSNATNHALAQNFGIKEWLQRLVAATNNKDLSGKVDFKFDKLAFQAGITIKMDAGGSFTYNFPYGTDFGSMGGSYTLDEQVTIAFTRDPDTADSEPLQFPPLPGKPYISQRQLDRAPARGPRGVSDDAKARLDSIQLEQLLRNLQLRP